MKAHGIIGLLLFFVLASGGSAFLSDNLTVYYKLDGSLFTSSTGFYNAVNSGTTNGLGKIIDGRNNTASTAIDLNANATVGANAVFGTGSFSTSGWYYTTNSTPLQYLASQSGATATTKYFFMAISSHVTGRPSVVLYDSGADFAINSSTVISNNTYTHMVFTYNNSSGNMLLYQNGAVVGNVTKAITRTNATSAQAAYLGSRSGSGLVGLIDEVGIWNKTLAIAEVAVLYNSGAGCAYNGFSTSTTTCDATNFFTVTLKDYYDNTSITTFNGTVNGTFYNTTNGTIVTSINSSSTGLVNITVNAATYISRSYENYNVSTALEATIFQAVAQFNATEIISGLNVANFTVNTTNQSNSTASYPYLYLKAGTYTVTFSKSGWYNKTQTFTVGSLTNYTYNFTDVYAYLLNVSAINNATGSAVTNFTVNITSGLYSYNNITVTTNGSALVPWTNDTNLNISLYDSPTIASTSILWNTSNYTSLPVTVNITISGVTYNSITFYFYNEINGTLMSGVNVTAYVTGSLQSTSFTTTNGTQFISLLVPSSYSVTYSATGYNQRIYTVYVTNQSTQTIVLYLRPSNVSTSVLMYVLDQTLNKVVGAQVNVNVMNLTGTNSYLVEMCTTDGNGQCIISADVSTSSYHSNTSYTFTVLYNNVTVGTSTNTQIASTANAACNSLLPCVQLLVSLSSAPLENFFLVPGLQASVVGYSPPDNFTFNFTDINNNVQEICLVSQIRTGAILTVTNSTCASSSSASLSLFSNTSLGEETIVTGTVTFGGSTYVIDEMSVPNNSSGGTGDVLFILFMGIGLLSTIFLSYKQEIGLAIIMVIVTLNILFLISALPVVVKGLITSIELLGLFILWRLRK